MIRYLFTLLPLLGIAAGAGIVLAALTGLRIIKVQFSMHRFIALFGISVLLLHVIVGVYLTYFRR